MLLKKTSIKVYLVSIFLIFKLFKKFAFFQSFKNSQTKHTHGKVSDLFCRTVRIMTSLLSLYHTIIFITTIMTSYLGHHRSAPTPVPTDLSPVAGPPSPPDANTARPWAFRPRLVVSPSYKNIINYCFNCFKKLNNCFEIFRV